MNEKSLQRKQRVRRRFRQIIRQVMANLYWLIDASDMEFGDNVRQNITLIYKGRANTDKQILSLEEKCMLRKRAEWRTKAEIERLYRSMSGLKCFRNWPDFVKYKLIQRTYFYYYEAGRVVVQQNRPALAMYFIISGKVEILLEVRIVMEY